MKSILLTVARFEICNTNCATQTHHSRIPYKSSKTHIKKMREQRIADKRLWNKDLQVCFLNFVIAYR